MDDSERVNEHPLPEWQKVVKERKGYMENLKGKSTEQKTEEEDIYRRRDRIREFKQSEVWKLDLEPKLIEILINLETQFCSTRDIYQRYALVEAYTTIKDFKLWINEVSEIK